MRSASMMYLSGQVAVFLCTVRCEDSCRTLRNVPAEGADSRRCLGAEHSI